MDEDYADDIALLANTPTQTESLLHSLDWAAADMDLHVNVDKTEFMCFNQRGDISILKGGHLKLVESSPTSETVSHQPRKTSTRH